MDNIPTTSLQKYPFGNGYTIKTWNVCTRYTNKTWNTQNMAGFVFITKFIFEVVLYVYYIDNNYNIDTSNIRRQVIRYVMSPNRRWRMKLKAKSCEEDKYHLIFNNVLTSDSDLLQSNTNKGCCMLDTTDYNYELRRVIERENEPKVTKWTWFNKQVRDTFLCS